MATPIDPARSYPAALAFMRARRARWIRILTPIVGYPHAVALTADYRRTKRELRLRGLA